MEQLLIVGGGLAGTLLALECYDRGIDFIWITTNHIPAASNAAYGICNPVHIRNMVLAWRADELYQTAATSFKKWTKQLGVEAYFAMPVNHLITDNDELVGWRQSTETTDLWKYTTGLPTHQFHTCLNPSFIAEVKINHCFYLNVPLFIAAAKKKLTNHIVDVEVSWNDLTDTGEGVTYLNKIYKKVIIADGSYATNNPFFTYIPFNLCKGEALKVKIEGLEMNEAIHKKLMLIPLGNNEFICGATYEWKDLSFNITQAGKNELLDQLQQILGNKYQIEVLEQRAGVRPTMPDRRPAVGWHPVYKNIGMLNGLGTKGLILGPAAVKNLIDNIQNSTPIWGDWDVKRFNKRFEKYSYKV